MYSYVRTINSGGLHAFTAIICLSKHRMIGPKFLGIEVMRNNKNVGSALFKIHLVHMSIVFANVT